MADTQRPMLRYKAEIRLTLDKDSVPVDHETPVSEGLAVQTTVEARTLLAALSQAVLRAEEAAKADIDGDVRTQLNGDGSVSYFSHTEGRFVHYAKRVPVADLEMMGPAERSLVTAHLAQYGDGA